MGESKSAPLKLLLPLRAANVAALLISGIDDTLDSFPTSVFMLLATFPPSSDALLPSDLVVLLLKRLLLTLLIPPLIIDSLPFIVDRKSTWPSTVPRDFRRPD
jgi:hypothetical protein